MALLSPRGGSRSACSCLSTERDRAVRVLAEDCHVSGMLQGIREGGSPAHPDVRSGVSAASGDPPSRSGPARQSALFLPCSHCAQHLHQFLRHTVRSTAESHSKTVIKTVHNSRGSEDVLASITGCARIAVLGGLGQLPRREDQERAIGWWSQATRHGRCWLTVPAIGRQVDRPRLTVDAARDGILVNGVGRLVATTNRASIAVHRGSS